MAEEWRIYYESNLPKTHGKYVKWEVSDLGNVKRNGELYKPKIYNGYFVVGCGRVHRMVAEMFIPNPDNKPCIDHINGNRQDNRVCNLRWCTHKENSNNPINIWKHQGENNGMYSRKQKEETRQLISDKRKGENNPMYGKPSPTRNKHRVYDNPEHTKYHYE